MSTFGLVATSVCRGEVCNAGHSSLLIVAKVPFAEGIAKYRLEIQNVYDNNVDVLCSREYTSDMVKNGYLIDIIDSALSCSLGIASPGKELGPSPFWAAISYDLRLLPKGWDSWTFSGGHGYTRTLYKADGPSLVWLTGLEWSFASEPSAGNVYLQIVYSLDGTANGPVLYNIQLTQPSGSLPDLYIPVAFGTPGYLVARLYNDKGLDFIVNVSYRLAGVEPGSPFGSGARLVLYAIDSQGNEHVLYMTETGPVYLLHIGPFNGLPGYAAPIFYDPLA